ncbi:MAG: hypothetical protein ACE5G7_07075 [Candidatus Hydrothermarchaeaceae archaeon]
MFPNVSHTNWKIRAGRDFSLWSVGFTLYLPYQIYAIALLLFSSAIIRLLSRGRSAGYGLAFLFIAGYTFQLTYQQLLLILGFVLLTLNREL